MSTHNIDTRQRILKAAWSLLEKNRGQGVRMSDIAKAAGLSRQAVYLHFESRTDLLIATTKYVDEVKGLDERLKIFQAANTGTELLEAVVEFWGNYIPEIYGIAKPMLNALDSDDAIAAAWSNCMGDLQHACGQAVEALDDENRLAPEWQKTEAIEMLMAMLSIHHWEHLTLERGWTTAQYIAKMTTLVKRAFVNG